MSSRGVLMAIFNFLRDAKLYIVHDNKQYNIDIANVSFNQTFTENSFSVKTLHTQQMFEGSVINRANPANFEFEMPAIRESDLQIALSLLLSASPCDLYIQSTNKIFKLTYAVFTNGLFGIEKLKELNISFSGEATRLTEVGVVGSYTIPGVVQARSAERTYNQTLYLSVLLNGSEISPHTYQVSAEYQNQIDWVPWATVNGALTAQNADTSMYPQTFVVRTKIFAGSIGQYITDGNSGALQNWDTSASLRIKAGQEVGSSFYGFDFNLASCSFTNRMDPTEVFTQSFDWRMNYNPASLTDVIKYVTL